MFVKRRNRYRSISPAQRICGVCFALFVLLQTPLVTVPIEQNGHIKDLPLSAVEITAISVHRHYPEYAYAMQQVILPGAWIKLLSKELFACASRAKSCAPRRLLDSQALMQASDCSPLAEPYQEAAGAASGMLALSCGMLLACAVAMPVVPDLTVSVVALGMVIFSIFQTACTPLPTIIFMSLLCLTAVFGSEPKRGSAITTTTNTATSITTTRTASTGNGASAGRVSVKGGKGGTRIGSPGGQRDGGRAVIGPASPSSPASGRARATSVGPSSMHGDSSGSKKLR